MGHLPNRRYIAAMIGFILLLIISGVYLLFRANGYRLLTNPVRLVKTGLISLTVHPATDLTIRLNGILQAKNVFAFLDLTPGRYTITIEREGMTPWEETVNLAAGEAIRLTDIVLFFTHPASELVVADARPLLRKTLDGTASLTSDLQIIGGEIWHEEQLVSRFSQPVIQAVWLPRKTHLLALVGTEIHVMEADGGHDQILARFSSQTSQIRFVPISGGAELLVEADGQLTIYTITEPFGILEPALQRLRSQVK